MEADRRKLDISFCAEASPQGEATPALLHAGEALDWRHLSPVINCVCDTDEPPGGTAAQFLKPVTWEAHNGSAVVPLLSLHGSL